MGTSAEEHSKSYIQKAEVLWQNKKQGWGWQKTRGGRQKEANENFRTELMRCMLAKAWPHTAVGGTVGGTVGGDDGGPVPGGRVGEIAGGNVGGLGFSPPPTRDISTQKASPSLVNSAIWL